VRAAPADRRVPAGRGRHDTGRVHLRVTDGDLDGYLDGDGHPEPQREQAMSKP
jgi:hypothetical protein